MERLLKINLFHILISLTAASFPAYQDLGSITNGWIVKNGNKSITVNSTVPGGIYSDLRAAEILPEDIFYRFNDEQYRWVSMDNWTYTSIFDVNPDILEKKRVVLQFFGLDTVANVFLNTRLIGETNNMFVLHQFDVKNLLKVSNNSVEVRFTSPVVAALQASSQTPYLVPPSCVPSVYHGECHVNYLRKMQASFAWDWGPAFPSVGIWKNVSLQAYDNAYARHVGVETRPEARVWVVSVTLYMDIREALSGKLTSTLFINDTDKIISERLVNVSPSTQDSSPSLVFPVPKEKVKLWWPNGHGSQPLYRLTVSFQSGKETTQKSIRIGFRTVKLVQEEAVPNNPKKGLTFYFRVNGVPIFAKGSNYIPLHILPELSAQEGPLRHLLTSTRDANMNMLRVWGGGLYESDLFYEMCDELGILVWQDMMFACAMYPATGPFLESVAAEVTEQVQRLQYHACIAVWAGNNENEAALAGNWYDTEGNFSTFKNDYIKLYVDTIRPIILKLDKTRSYVTSSPSNGQESESEGYVAKNPYDNRYGDVHWYQYEMNLWNPVVFPKTRFASEYGIMSLPSLESFKNISIPSDLRLTSEFMTRRQHHSTGYVQMISEISHNLYLPVDPDLETFTYLSQINQAMSIKTETESYRRGRNTINAIGEGMTMGALYWQLNDVWQAPSWSSIELSGKWKMLHYFAADFFAPVLVSPSIDVRRQLRASVISDQQLHSSKDAMMQLSIYNWKSLTPVYKNFYPFTMKGAGVVEVASWNIDSFLSSLDGCKSPDKSPNTSCFFYFSLLSSNGSSSLGPDNFYFPLPLHSVTSPPKANIQVVSVKSFKNGHELVVTLSTDAIAPFVWLDTVGLEGHFSHNGFLMVTNQTQLVYTSQQAVDEQLFKRFLKIKSLEFHKS